MPDNSQALPGGTTKAADRARRLAIWIGPSIRPADGTLVAKDLLALGAELALGHDTVLRAVAQAHPGTATDLLPELEEQYGLPDGTGLATSARQARLLAKVRARREGTKTAILATVRALDPTATIVGVPWNSVTHHPRATHRFVVVIPTATWRADATRAAIEASVEQQKPAHTEAMVANGASFRCDDPESLCDATCLAW